MTLVKGFKYCYYKDDKKILEICNLSIDDILEFYEDIATDGQSLTSSF